MISFPGQLTCRALNALQTFTWFIPPYYLQAFFHVRTKTFGFFVVNEP